MNTVAPGENGLFFLQILQVKTAIVDRPGEMTLWLSDFSRLMVRLSVECRASMTVGPLILAVPDWAIGERVAYGKGFFPTSWEGHNIIVNESPNERCDEQHQGGDTIVSSLTWTQWQTTPRGGRERNDQHSVKTTPSRGHSSAFHPTYGTFVVSQIDRRNTDVWHRACAFNNMLIIVSTPI